MNYHVSVRGNDSTGKGTQLKPWKTLKFAALTVQPNQDHTIKLDKGIFVEDLTQIPEGVNIEGAGIDRTILKSSVVYNPLSPGYALEKFLLTFSSTNRSQGRQWINNFSIDGDQKKLHGGIYIRNRANIEIRNVKIIDTNFTGMWLWDVSHSYVKDVQINNASWGSAGYSSGALNIGTLNNVVFDHVDINENVGYGIKAIGPDLVTELTDVKIINSVVSVNPVGLWVNPVSGSKAPNIAIEFWKGKLVGCEIYNTYVDNTISLVGEDSLTSKGVQSIRVHHNIIDIDTRANGAGYGIELSVHDAEIDHNYFIKGSYGIANWAARMSNWNIHHNIFYALSGKYPGEALRSQIGGLHNVKFYHNTVEFFGANTMNVIGLYGGVSENIDVKNNLLIDNNTAYSYYPNKLTRLEKGAVIMPGTLHVNYNSLTKIELGSVPGGDYSMNMTTDPKITKEGVRPYPYYTPKPDSLLIGKGIDLGYGKNIGTF
jgi:hypothetical protein